MCVLKKYLVFLLAVISVIGCTDHKLEPRLSNTCSVQNPVQDLPWLRQKIDDLRQSPHDNWFVRQGVYDGQTIFVFDICCPNCDYVAPVHDCSGQRILDSVYAHGTESVISDLVTIAQAENFECM